MARKSELVTVPLEGRDLGKVYQITEMSAVQAEKWALRLLIALKGSGSEIPELSQRLGMIGIAFAGVNAFLRAEVRLDLLEPLLDEMMTCVKIVRDPNARDKLTGGAVATAIASDDDIAEPRTRLWLRGEILRVHTDFSLAEALSTWTSATKALASSNAQTSPLQ
jgi:hypothetical protein